jgi:hypothetical protein
MDLVDTQGQHFKRPMACDKTVLYTALCSLQPNQPNRQGQLIQRHTYARLNSFNKVP